MKTYILKRPVYNYIDFPIGTIVELFEKPTHQSMITEAVVVEGELKGEKLCVADGFDGWIVDDTEENRTLIQRCIEQEENLKKQLKQNSE